MVVGPLRTVRSLAPWREPECLQLAQVAEESLLLFTSLLREAPAINIHASYLDFGFFEELRSDVIPPLRKSDNSDNVYLSPDPSILLLEPAVRSERLFTIMMGRLARLIEARGWDPEPFARLEQQCRERDLKFHYYGPPKFNRRKQHQARGHFWFSDEGVAMASIQILDSAGEPLAESEGLRAHYVLEGLARAGKTLRWDDATTVSMRAFADRFNIYPARVRMVLDPSTQSWTSSSDASDFDRDDDADVGGWEPSGPGLADLPGGPPSAALPPNGLGLEVPETSADLVPGRAAGDSVPGRPLQIRAIGGGPTNGVPHDYQDTLHRLLDAVTGPAWQTWYTASDQAPLEIYYNFAHWATPGVRVRRGRHSVKGTIDRPTPTMIAASDPAELAREDVLALMTAVQRKFKLGPMPPLEPEAFS